MNNLSINILKDNWIQFIIQFNIDSIDKPLIFQYIAKIDDTSNLEIIQSFILHSHNNEFGIIFDNNNSNFNLNKYIKIKFVKLKKLDINSQSEQDEELLKLCDELDFDFEPEIYEFINKDISDINNINFSIVSFTQAVQLINNVNIFNHPDIFNKLLNIIHNGPTEFINFDTNSYNYDTLFDIHAISIHNIFQSCEYSLINNDIHGQKFTFKDDFCLFNPKFFELLSNDNIGIGTSIMEVDFKILSTETQIFKYFNQIYGNFDKLKFWTSFPEFVKKDGNENYFFKIINNFYDRDFDGKTTWINNFYFNKNYFFVECFSAQYKDVYIDSINDYTEKLFIDDKPTISLYFQRLM